MAFGDNFTARDWLALLSPFVLGLESAFKEALNDGIEMLVEVAKAFPNVWRMLDAFTRFATSLIGRALTVPFRGLEEALQAQLRRWKVHNRLLRLDEATKLYFRSWEELVQAITFTDETGLLGLLVGSVARRFYRFFKQSKLLFILVKAWREEQFVAAVITAFESKLWRLWYLLIVGLIFILGAGLGAMLFFIGVGIQVLNGSFAKAILPQDSKRVWRKKGAVVRSNARTGPDEPV